MSVSRYKNHFSKQNLFKALWFLCIIHFLSAQNLTQNVDVYTMSSTQGFKIASSLGPTGNSMGMYFGISAKKAGDVNGDGKGDVIIGAVGDNNGLGVVYVVYGSDALFSDIDTNATSFSPTQGFKIYDSNAALNNYLGISASFAGDVNGDGIDDIIIGAPNKNGSQGVAYVVYGNYTLTDVDLSSPSFNPLQGFTITHTSKITPQVGISVNYAGDVNGDGVDDVIVGAISEDSARGSAYVIFGNKTPILNIDLGDSNFSPGKGFRIWNSTGVYGEQFGNIVNYAGDLNGDNVDDIIIGAIGTNNINGAAYVVYGRKTGIIDVDVSSVSFYPAQGFLIWNSGGQYSDQLGYAVCGLGDINGDNIDDIAIGAIGENGMKGAVYIIYGKGSNMANVDLELGNFALDQGFKIHNSTVTTDLKVFGYSVNNAGDINGDNVNDIIIGAYAEESLKGASYVILGRKNSRSDDLDLGSGDFDLTQGYKLTNSDPMGMFFGVSVCSAGDVNGDNMTDLIIGAAGSYDYKGSVYIVYGVNLTCSNGCQHCTNSTSCQICISGFELTGSQCIEPEPEPEPEPKPEPELEPEPVEREHIQSKTI